MDLVLTANQMQLFSAHMAETFVNKTMLFLRKNFADWAIDKDDAALADYIRSMMALGKKHHILKQINLQKLMHYHIRYAFNVPLSKDHANILDDKKYNENNRVKNLLQHLQSVSMTVNSDKQ